MLPLYKMRISDDDPVSGVDYVALVDMPATEFNWQAFNKQKEFAFQTQNAEQRIICGALMVTDLPIYRKEGDREYYVLFEAGEIKKICYKYFRNRFTGNVNLMHDATAKVGGVYMVQSFLIDKESGINAPSYYPELPDGSWFGVFKVDNEELWQDYIKTGKFKGFSVEGMFGMEQVNDDEKVLKQLMEIVNEND